MRSAIRCWPARPRSSRKSSRSKLNTKTRTVLLGYAQRAAAHFASLTDATNAFACGEAAVRAAIAGESGKMVKIVRDAQPDGSVKWSTGLQPLADIANVEHFVPRDWISEDGFLPNEKFVEYARPLIEGEVKFPARRRPAQVRRAGEEQGGEEAPPAPLSQPQRKDPKTQS